MNVNKLFPIIFILCGALLICLQVQSVFSFAHLHLDWVCKSGEKMIQVNTPDSIVNEFRNECSSTKGKIKEISNTVIKNSLITSMFGVIVIITGILQYIIVVFQKRKKPKSADVSDS